MAIPEASLSEVIMKTVLVILFLGLGGCSFLDASVGIVEGEGYFTGAEYCTVTHGEGFPEGVTVSYHGDRCQVQIGPELWDEQN